MFSPVYRTWFAAVAELIATYSYPRLAKLKLPPGEHQLLLTKGDNNHVDDIELYRGLDWLERRHIVGKVRGYVSFALFFFVPYFFTISDLVPCWLPHVSPLLHYDLCSYLELEFLILGCIFSLLNLPITTFDSQFTLG